MVTAWSGGATMWQRPAPEGTHREEFKCDIRSNHAGRRSRPGEVYEDVDYIVDDAPVAAVFAEHMAELNNVSIEEAERLVLLIPTLIEINERFQKEHADTFAGLWVDYRPFRVSMAFVRDAPARVDEVRSEYALRADEVVAVEAQHTLEQLYDTSTILHLAVEGFSPALPGLAGISPADFYTEVDEPGNRVVVRTPDPAAVRAAITDETIADRVELIRDGPIEIILDAETVYGGLGQSPVACTTGFTIVKNGSIEAGLVVPSKLHGPCGTPTGIIGKTLPLGPSLQDLHETWNASAPTDSQWVGLADRDWQPRNYVRTYCDHCVMTITSRLQHLGAYYGMPVHMTGNTTGQSEGIIVAKRVNNMNWLAADYVSTGGDSGGSVYSNHIAVGTHRGRAEVDGIDRAFLGSIEFWEARWGVKVATSIPVEPTLQRLVRNSNSPGIAERIWDYGESWKTAVHGDWNGDGADQPGTFSAGTWDREGLPVSSFGSSGVVPFVGNWDWDAYDERGYYVPWTQQFFFEGIPSGTTYGDPGDVPIIGDWNGDGFDNIGVYRPSTQTFHRNITGYDPIAFGNPGDIPLVGDWDGNRTAEVGVYRPSEGKFYLRLNQWTTIAFIYGDPWEEPAIGNWDGVSGDTIAVVRHW